MIATLYTCPADGYRLDTTDWPADDRSLEFMAYWITTHDHVEPDNWPAFFAERTRETRRADGLLSRKVTQ